MRYVLEPAVHRRVKRTQIARQAFPVDGNRRPQAHRPELGTNSAANLSEWQVREADILLTGLDCGSNVVYAISQF
jgi:hypothetical protein